MKINRTRLRRAGLTALIIGLSFATVAYAHGVIINYNLKSNGEVELYAEFDTGEALDEAQVTVYAPADPANPWLTGVADETGTYTFVVDPEMPGIWDVQFRKAGHGDIVHIQFEAGMVNPELITQPPGELQPDLPAAETIAPAEQAVPQAADQAISVITTGGSNANSGGFTSLQILLMSASVVWGFIGTALYFSVKKEHGHDH